MESVPREEISFASYILRLWRKRWLILCVTFLITLGMAVYVQFFADEVYITSAQILMKEQPNLLNVESNRISPYTWESVMINDDLIGDVMERYEKESGRKFVFERFKKRFSTDIGKLEDTSIRTRYSPVIELEAKGNTPQEAYREMELWTSLIIERYGSLQSNSVNYSKQSLEEKMARIQERLNLLEADYMAVRWQMPNKIKTMAEKENLLSPSIRWTFIPRNRHDFQTRGAAADQRVDVVIQQESFPMESDQKGLRARLAEINIEIAKLEAVPGGGASEELAKLRAEEKKVKELIAATEKEIEDIQMEVAKLEKNYEETGRTIEGLRAEYRLLAETKAKLDTESDVLESNGRGPYEGSNLQMIAGPVVPDQRAEPKKAVMCLITAVLAFLLMCTVVLTHKYLEDAAKLTAQS